MVGKKTFRERSLSHAVGSRLRMQENRHSMSRLGFVALRAAAIMLFLVLLPSVSHAGDFVVFGFAVALGPSPGSLNPTVLLHSH